MKNIKLGVMLAQIYFWLSTLHSPLSSTKRHTKRPVGAAAVAGDERERGCDGFAEEWWKGKQLWESEGGSVQEGHGSDGWWWLVDKMAASTTSGSG